MTTDRTAPKNTPASIIRTLPDRVANQIAAGEVVERPASVIKELVENGLDAGATEITVSFRNGGKSLIIVTDNGKGMSKDDALLAFERHATSKIVEADDLKSVATLGFRGEALPSIASVCRLKLSTSIPGSSVGVAVEIEGGVIRNFKDAPPLTGASVEIKDLFYNTPVRRKFLRSEKVEAEHAAEAVYRQAVANPSVRFRLVKDGKQILDAMPANDGDSFLRRIKEIFGDNIATALVPVGFEHAGMRVTGFVSRPSVTRSSADMQYIYVNGRYIRDRQVNFAVYEGYRSLLPKGRKPALFLHITMPPDRVDVNVHPTKIEVRFVDGRSVVQLVRGAIYNALAATKESDSGEGFANTGFSAKPVEDNRLWEQSTPTQPSPVATDPWKAPPPVGTSNHSSFHEPTATQSTPPTAPEPTPTAEGAPLLHYDSGIPDEFAVVGQIFGAFILLEEGDRLLLIDQHTAHERVLYELFMNKYREGAPDMQELLFPVEVELTRREAEVMNRFLPQFEKLGFLIEHFGDQTYNLRSAPPILKNKDQAVLIRDTLDRLGRFGDTSATEELVEGAINIMACRAAVKANDKLNREEIDALIRQLRKCQLPYTCPHGRPIALAIERDDLLKGFLRK